MGGLYMMVTVAARSMGERFLAYYHEAQIEVQLVTLGRGTADDEMLDCFGLESHEKAILFSVVSRETWEEQKPGLRWKLHLDLPGTGVAFAIPLSSVGGRGTFEYFAKGMTMEKKETEVAEMAYEMIIAVANQGYIEPIMEAARSAGAGGGTVIHAKGTGMEGMGKFFGVSLAAEKEMIFIVTEKEKRSAIMTAIMKQAGMNTKARAFLFSVPVESVAGLYNF